MKQTSLLTLPQYPLCKNDFTEQFHRIMYVAITKLTKAGVSEITEIEVENLIKNYPTQMEILIDNNYCDFISTMKELCVLENYEMYYNTVRKLSLLRELKENGHSIKEFYDELGNENEELAKLEKWSIQDILNNVELKTSGLRNKYDVKYVRNEIQGGENVQERINLFKERPSFGAFMQSGYLNTIYQGWSRGHLLLRAGASSSGKSRTSVADLTHVGMLEIWDDEAQDFLPNPNYQTPTLFIASEQDPETEIEPMFWSSVSGVEYRKIKNGTMTDDEEKRVVKAGEIIKNSGLTITSMPNFTNQSLYRKLKQKVETEGIGYAVFDYLEIQSDLSAEFKAKSAVPPRQDLVLLNTTSELKMYCEDLNIGLMFGCQLRDEWKEARFIDESYLSGSRAMKNKLDCGSIIVPTTYLKKDMKILEPFFKRRGFGENRIPLPNICETIFKSRYSIYGDRRLKLWSYFDRGTFRRYDYFLTDDNNEVQSDIKPTFCEKII